MKVWRVCVAVIGWLAASAIGPGMVAAQTPPISAQATPGPAITPPAIEDFIAPAFRSHASLSPSGRYLIWVLRAGKNSVIEVRDTETGTSQRISVGSSSEEMGGIFVNWIAWKTDDLFLVSTTQLDLIRARHREDGAVRGYRFGHLVQAVSRDGATLTRLAAPGAVDYSPGQVLDMLRGDPQHVLMTYRNDTGGLNIARVDVATGQGVRILSGDQRVRSYITDTSGEVVGRIAVRGGGRAVLMEARVGEAWEEVYRLRRDDIRELSDYRVLGATDQPGKVFVAVQPEEGATTTAGVHIFDFATRTMGPVVWGNATYDVAGIVQDADTLALMGGCYWDDIYRCDFLDRSDNAVMSGIRTFLGPGWSASVVSQARDGSRWLVRAWAANSLGEYYLFDLGARRMTPLGTAYPRLRPERLGVMQRIDYATRDGQPLFGYLTRPPGIANDARPPLVVMPHGGPEVRDTMTYDLWVQFLASRGYQVFQPNFRGSSGLGRAFAEAGHRQWGLRMQDDVTDGVQDLIAQGLADPSRICVMGASYGGYAALQSGATQTDLYRCVIAISGPSDLMAMLRHERSEGGEDSDRYEYWVKSIGDPRADRTAIEAASPLRRAADWRLPILLIHGDADDIVPVEQSREMDRALRRAGKEVRFVELEDEGHNNWSSKVEAQVLNEIETFLARHLPTDPAPQAQTGSVATDAARAVASSPP